MTGDPATTKSEILKLHRIIRERDEEIIALKWKPTMSLRVKCESGFGATVRILQQLWASSDGDEDWRDVEEFWP